MRERERERKKKKRKESKGAGLAIGRGSQSQTKVLVNMTTRDDQRPVAETGIALHTEQRGRGGLSAQRHSA